MVSLGILWISKYMNITNNTSQLLSSTHDDNSSKNSSSNSKPNLSFSIDSSDDMSYNQILENVLQDMSQSQKEAHLSTLETLKEKGYKEEELNIINKILLSEKAGKIVELNKYEDDIYDEYKITFKEVMQAIQDRFYEDLKMKKLKIEMFVSDTTLTIKDNQEKLTIKEQS
jgi:formate dehydrogenase maturation protein FdhE